MIKAIENVLIKIIIKFSTILRRGSFNSVYLGNNIVLTQTIERVKLYLFADDLSITPEILANGIWEPNITKIFKKYAKNSKIILEVGANIGYYSTLGSHYQTSKNSKYIAVEANPETFQLLKNNIEINGLKNKTQLVNKIFHKEGGKNMDLFIPFKHNASSSVVEPLVDDGFKKIKMETISANQILKEDERIDLIKIDAEGCEYEILVSLEKFIKDETKIIIEYFPKMIIKNGNNPKDLLNFILKKGFSIQVINSNGSLNDFNSEKELVEHVELIAKKDE